MAHFFEKRDRWGNGLALWVVAGMAFVLPICIWSIRSISPNPKPSEWLSAENPQAQATAWARQQFPHEEIVWVTWEGSNLADARVKTFVESIAGQKDADGIARNSLKQVQQVRTPQELIAQAVKNQIPEPEAVRRLQGSFVGIGTIKVLLTEAGRAEKQQTIERLKAAVNDRLNTEITIKEKAASTEGTIAVPLVEPKLVADDDAEAKSGEVAALTPEHDLQVTWNGLAWRVADFEVFQQVAKGLRSKSTAQKPEGEPVIERCFLTPGSPIALAVVLSEAGQADQHAALQLIKERAVSAGIPEATLHLGGAPVVRVALRDELAKAAWNKSVPAQRLHERSVLLVACLVGLGLSIWMLRSTRLIIAVMGIAYLGVLYSVAFIPVIGGSPNILMLAIPAVLISTTLSAAIHFVNYWKQAALTNPQTALRTALQRAQNPTAWAGAITIVGFASLLASTLGPIRDFGMYSAIGSGISLVLVLLGLPALLQIWSASKPQATELDDTDWRNVGSWLTQRQRVIVPLVLVLAVAAESGLIRSRTPTKPLRQFTDQTQVVQDYNYFENVLGGTAPVELVVRFDADAQEEMRFIERAAVVRRIENELGRLSDVSSTLSLAKFLPEVEPLAEKASNAQKSRYSAKSREIEELAKEDASAVNGLYAIAKDRSQFNAAGDELWRITARVSSLSPMPYQTLTAQLDDICCSVLKNVPVHGTEKYHQGADPVYYHPGASHIIAGQLPVSLAAQQEMTQGLIRVGLIFICGIGAVTIAMLKNPRAGVLAAVPITLPLAVVCGLVGWCGVAVDAGTVAATACVLALSANGTLHMLAEFRRQLAAGKSRNEASTTALAVCGPAIWQTSVIVGLGMFVLYSSDLQPISRFGWMTASMVLSVLITNLVLTPTMLAGPLGQLLVDPAAEEAAESGVEGAVANVAGEKLAATSTVNGSALPRPHLETAAVMRVRRVE